MAIWKIDELGEFVTLKRGYDLPQQKRKNGEIPIFSSSGVTGTHNEAMVEAPGVITGRYGTIGEVFFAETSFWPLNTTLYVENFHENDEKFVYYFLKTLEWKKFASASAVPGINRNTVHKEIVRFPDFETQQKIASVLSTIDKKIAVNKAINDNLEQQLRSVFMELFSDKIANVEANNHRPLGELVINIDNRGKTPPLETTPTEYPIIDVRALSGTSRIVNYANCTKFVSAETYSSWFRSGHPKPKDILVSTVGSLAEIKIFLGSKGCIAQNVVGFRTKDISPYYLYQYLTAIKNDLVAYNIGSVQPSIKVTHIIKHPIYIPSTEELETFDALAESATNAIYNNTLESERLAGIRDALIPKLMSGEIDLSEVQF